MDNKSSGELSIAIINKAVVFYCYLAIKYNIYI